MDSPGDTVLSKPVKMSEAVKTHGQVSFLQKLESQLPVFTIGFTCRQGRKKKKTVCWCYEWYTRLAEPLFYLLNFRLL